LLRASLRWFPVKKRLWIGNIKNQAVWHQRCSKLMQSAMEQRTQSIQKKQIESKKYVTETQ
jgi:hypothetical protein